MPLAYCILAHKNPEQVRRLIDRLGDGALVYVNVFNHSNTEQQARWRKTFDGAECKDLTVRFKYGGSWGAFNLVQATLDAMQYFRDQAYSHFINLSGQCYPIKPVNEIERYFQNSDKSYISFKQVPWPEPMEDGCGYMTRFDNYWFRMPTLARSGHSNMVKIPRIRKTIPGGLKPYKGAQWFALRKKEVDTIFRMIDDNPALLRFFHRVKIPDESFFHTIIGNSEGETVNDNLRFIDWTKKGVPLPAFLGNEDIEALKTSSRLFARKFDQEKNPELLDRVDRELLSVR